MINQELVDFIYDYAKEKECTFVKTHLTPRDIMDIIGTECTSHSEAIDKMNDFIEFYNQEL